LTIALVRPIIDIAFSKDGSHMPEIPPDNSEYLSPAEMHQWLEQEISDSAKALELRMKEAASLVTAYFSGEISAQQAAERHWNYQKRWGEALPGTSAIAGLTDQEILATIDRTREPDFHKRLTRRHVQSSRSQDENTRG
jgi:hypothetical protein